MESDHRRPEGFWMAMNLLIQYVEVLFQWNASVLIFIIFIQADERIDGVHGLARAVLERLAIEQMAYEYG